MRVIIPPNEVELLKEPVSLLDGIESIKAVIERLRKSGLRIRTRQERQAAIYDYAKKYYKDVIPTQLVDDVSWYMLCMENEQYCSKCYSRPSYCRYNFRRYVLDEVTVWGGKKYNAPVIVVKVSKCQKFLLTSSGPKPTGIPRLEDYNVKSQEQF